MHKVDNAVIMAAGYSSRLAPLSYETHKGLLKVKGEVLIERQIRQLREAGIKDVTVVTGYRRNDFAYLADEFAVELVDNPDYCRYNNPSSLLKVAERLRNTYVCSCDNYFTENVFEPEVEKAYYAATFYPGESNEWGIETDAAGRITGINHAPVDMWCMMGHVFFDEKFSRTFRLILRRNCDNPRVLSRLWEYILEENLGVLDMDVRKYREGIVKEFDSLEELRAFDKKYVNNSGSRIFRNIKRTLKCREEEIGGIEVIKQGLTNRSFKFDVGGKAYVYRHPGEGTEDYISRRSEAFSLRVAKKLGLDWTLVAFNAEQGWKISEFVSSARTLDYHNEDDVGRAIGLMRRLHDAKIKTRHVFGIWEKTCEFVKAASPEYRRFKGAQQLFSEMEALYYSVSRKTGGRKYLSHCDCYSPNFLVEPSGDIALIDWEYSGAEDYGVDIGTFVCCSDWTEKDADAFLDKYNGQPRVNRYHDYAWIALAAYYWFVWAVYQEKIGNPVGGYLDLWHKMALTYLKKAQALGKAESPDRAELKKEEQ